MTRPKEPVILFDGVCGLCNAWVDFVLKHDRAKRFRFSPLQSGFAARALTEHGLDATKLGSIVLLDGGRAATESTAVIQIFAGLGIPWSLARVLFLVPRSIRNASYRTSAKHRYRIGGRENACRMPTPDERPMFIL